MNLINLLVKLTLFLYLEYEYNFIEDIATKTLVLLLHSLSILFSLYIYQKI